MLPEGARFIINKEYITQEERYISHHLRQKVRVLQAEYHLRDSQDYPISHIKIQQLRFIEDPLLSLFKGTQK